MQKIIGPGRKNLVRLYFPGRTACSSTDIHSVCVICPGVGRSQYRIP
ncbi:MAG: hypothetical protein J6A74_06755 [Oscillospiraceae bacterium]|nr:hypothetical protein [Oscillospiraceae bacterium]